MEQQSPAWIVPAAGLVGAALVAFANFLVQRWRFRIDRLGGSVDHLCAESNSIADLCSEYWLLDTSIPDQRAKADLMEAQLIGRQMRLDSLMLALRSLDRKLNLTRAEILMLDFHDALTGGQFKVSGRPAFGDKAQQAQAVAAQLNGELRHAISLRSRRWL